MPKPRALSGRDVLRVLRTFGFQNFDQHGSRVLGDGRTQTLTVPNHDEIDRGTLHAIYRQACRFILKPELRVEFFTD